MSNNEEIYDAEVIYDSATDSTTATTEGEIIDIEEPSDYWKLVAFHLQENHQPSIPLNMVDTCIKAIEYANNKDWNVLIALPDGTTYKGSTHATVETIVESHHLHNFITSDREVVTIKDAEGSIVYQGYGTELKLNAETNTEVESDDDQQ
jgi:(2Fe-2S) ferredoxin